jgi:hypothetical protein
MGSKSSKPSAHSKLQPSDKRKDQAELADPPNYNTHRSKSMRKKAGKTPGGAAATGGSTGGSGGGL